MGVDRLGRGSAWRCSATALIVAVFVGSCGVSADVDTAQSESTPTSTPESVAPTGAAAAPAATVDSERAPAATVVPEPTATARPTSSPPPIPTPAATPTSSPPPIPTPAATPTSNPPPNPEADWFLEIVAIDEQIRAVIEPTSWREGCPVGLDGLRLLRFPYVDFDGEIGRGELIVAAEWADDIGAVFEQLFEAAFPIQRIELVDAYGGDDQASMRANNTSGFNCREVSARPGVWSNHAFGTAIDVNPLVNPYVGAGFVDPPEGAAYADRSDVRTGMIVAGDPAVRAFASIGWVWGGTWSGAQDFQHFSANGR